MRRTLYILVSSMLLTAAAQAADSSAPPRSECFFVNALDGWRAQDAKTINIRVNMNRFYRLGLVSDCRELLLPGAHLILNVRGSNTICSPIDWDLKVSTGMHDIPQACIVATMTRLTPDDVAAIPKKLRP